jgi:predicted TPR repeat methyltransferase
MEAQSEFLAQVYDITETGEVHQFYEEWADRYDREMAENGYVSPARCAAALSGFVKDMATAILDIGCGTGISGQSFRDAGFSQIDGTDFSQEMLEVAANKDVYRNTFKADLTNPLPFEPGDYGAIAAVGVLTPAHAPAETLDDVIAKLLPGGYFVFSLNDHALEDRTYEGRIRENVDGGMVELLFKEYGDHMPTIGLNSSIYVLRKR